MMRLQTTYTIFDVFTELIISCSHVGHFRFSTRGRHDLGRQNRGFGGEWHV
ncbi:uncharacterized protein METZ01_LOCUS417869 [marine metagenome]|uniref:Uncharacterized protein n=1 Tax=marine metagenome TaxID=408172 RepID=A0A382X334_9ZZZZ